MGASVFSTIKLTKKQRLTRFWQYFAIVLVNIVISLVFVFQGALAAPGDYVWQKAPTNLTGDFIFWDSIASSADGSRLAAADTGGSIYTSSDYGVSWTEQTAAGSRYWRSIAMSTDGSRLAAADIDGSIYTSSDYGVSWTEQTVAGSRYWSSIAMSTDGSRLAAGVSGGSIYTSSDYGVSWTEQTAAGSRYWQSIAMSTDGSRLAVAEDGGNIYLATQASAATEPTNPPGQIVETPQTSVGLLASTGSNTRTLVSAAIMLIMTAVIVWWRPLKTYKFQ